MAGEQHRRRLRTLIKLAGIDDPAPARLEAAFVHESAAREEGGASNERMEFLGDAILGFVVSEWLYEHYGSEPEGDLAKRKAAIVADTAIAHTARQLDFSGLIRVGGGERASGAPRRTSILADAFEAFVAALYLEYGLETARRFVIREHVERLDHADLAKADAKTLLQEFTQLHFACMPAYRDEGEGPAHERRFTSYVTVNGETLGSGTGHSKKSAQQRAAAQALLALQTGKA
ncbi:MAG: ribonuclease III [Candidatus Eremiobacteraeota bacterium]|nr:ribonuclease III [Candidatus Eremiobacteraeota bacterium]